MSLKQIIGAIIPFSIGITLLNIVGCNSESVDSQDVRSSGIWAKMEVDGRGDGRSRVVVELNAGGRFGTNVVLSGGEYLEVVAAGVTKRMVEDNDILDIDYQAYIDSTVSETEFNIRFYRNDGENITNSRAFLPTSFEITQPLTNTSYGLEDNVILVWTPEVSNGSIRLFSSISCTSSEGGGITRSESNFIDDTGTYNFDISAANMFENGTTGLNTAQSCGMEFTLQRESFGNVDPAFGEGGSFKATQSREVGGLTINPQ